MERKTKIAVFFRSLLLQVGWNYQHYQALGFTYVMLVFLKKIYSEEELKRVLPRYLDGFNAHPIMASYAFGALAKLEEAESKKEIFDISEWEINKSFLMTSLASIGDRLFWDTLVPFALTCALTICLIFDNSLFSMEGEIIISRWQIALSAVIYILVYSVPALIVRWRGIEEGQKGDNDDCFGLLKTDWNKIIKVLKGAGFGLAVIMLSLGLYGQFAALVKVEEFVIVGSVSAFFMACALIAEKLHIPNVFIYALSVIVFSVVILLI
ncbi:PTS system protein [Parelusimicrobium proximum]|uniref:PTS system mannose/fructose/sorbose family transporter subunit IID n=1 Tax=Parelusimicrobium proximum TaxID=3228953 RepID=UPI003D1666BB